MTKKTKQIRLTEAQMQQIIKSAVAQCLKEEKGLTELNWKTYAKAAGKRMEQGKEDNAEELSQFATDRFNDEFGHEELDGTYDENGLPYRQDVKGTVTPFGSGYVGMGRWTPMQSQMHAGYYPKSNGKDSHLINPRSKMKPTKNIADKYVKAADEMEKFADVDESVLRETVKECLKEMLNK